MSIPGCNCTRCLADAANKHERPRYLVIREDGFGVLIYNNCSDAKAAAERFAKDSKNLPERYIYKAVGKVEVKQSVKYTDLT